MTPLARRMLVANITMLAILAGFGLMLYLMVGRAREAAIASSCHGRMFKIALALDEYRADIGKFLPRSAIDSDGRTIRWPELLPRYLLYEEMDGQEFLAENFLCPSGARYLLVVGPGTIVQDQPVVPETVSDGMANTLVAIEATDRLVPRPAICELTLNDLDHDPTVPATSIHPAGRGLVFADGAIYRQLKPLSASQLRSLMTIAGGEPVTRDELERQGYLTRIGAVSR